MSGPLALVVGGSSGIGATACRRLRAEGWHVVGLARRPSNEADEFLCADITRFEELQAALSGLGSVGLLVHAAAVIGPVEPLPATDPEAWRRTVEVNLVGTYNVLRTTLAGPLASERAIAIHLTSGAASVAKPYWSAYSASKAGAEHLIRSAALDMEGSGRAVCALDPGITETPMQEELRRLDFPDRERFVQAFERRESRTPEDVADAIVELSRRDPAELNGVTFMVGSL
jgi:NAD(P)-dependent dehydrogenase (short-subunit alcohol dehydrogenase family)